MASSRHYDEEDYGRMEFLAYFIFALAMIGVTSTAYFVYDWLIS